MASKRDLKKDIRYLTEIVIIEAIELSEVVSNEESRKKVYEVIFQIADLHNNLISRTNHPDGKFNTPIIRAHYRAIVEDLMKGCNNAFNELNQITL